MRRGHTGREEAGNDDVRCLRCGTVYPLPLDPRAGGDRDCPRCGYVGWIAVSIPLGRPAGARKA